MTKNNNSKTDWREIRRFRALALKKKGWKQAKIAEALGVCEGAVSQWFTKVEQGGEEVLHTQPKCGAPPKLSPDQIQQLASLLLAGPQAYGFEGQVWTSGRVSWLIQFKFGVKLHRAHVSRLLRGQLHWSVQKPVEKASQRDEAVIAKFKEERWPQLIKKAQIENRTIVWIDESAFYLLPGVVRTYAPRGQTPVLKTECSYSHLSVISAITPSGQLYFATQERAYTSEDVVVFLKELRRKIGGKLLIIWDGAPIHRGQPIKDYLASGAAKSNQFI